MIININKELVLENNIVQLSSISKDNLYLLKDVALANPNITKYSPTIFNDEISVNAYINDMLLNNQQKQRISFIIYDKIKNQVVGTTSFANISNYDKRLEIGYTWLAKSAQGTTINKNCKYLLLSYAFEVLDFERVELKTDERNLQSRKAIQKIGATEEGVLRSHTLMHDGYRRNTVYFSILKNEWQTIKSTIFNDCHSNQ